MLNKKELKTIFPHRIIECSSNPQLEQQRITLHPDYACHLDQIMQWSLEVLNRFLQEAGSAPTFSYGASKFYNGKTFNEVLYREWPARTVALSFEMCLLKRIATVSEAIKRFKCYEAELPVQAKADSLQGIDHTITSPMREDAYWAHDLSDRVQAALDLHSARIALTQSPQQPASAIKLPSATEWPTQPPSSHDTSIASASINTSTCSQDLESSSTRQSSGAVPTTEINVEAKPPPAIIQQLVLPGYAARSLRTWTSGSSDPKDAWLSTTSQSDHRFLDRHFLLATYSPPLESSQVATSREDQPLVIAFTPAARPARDPDKTRDKTLTTATSRDATTLPETRRSYVHTECFVGLRLPRTDERRLNVPSPLSSQQGARAPAKLHDDRATRQLQSDSTLALAGDDAAVHSHDCEEPIDVSPRSTPAPSTPINSRPITPLCYHYLMT
jgi:hypothetical protein